MAEQKTTDTTESAPKKVGSTKYVRYTGIASLRTISKEQWEKAGVSDQDYVAWARDTDHKVPQDRFTAAALDVLRQNGDFVIEG